MSNITGRNTISAACMGIFVLFALGSIPIGNTVNIGMINSAKETLSTSLANTQDKSSMAKDEIEDAYTQMKEYLASKNLSDASIARMENRLDSMKSRHEALVETVAKCNKDGNELFSMLDRRAGENKTENLRKSLKEKISTKKKLFQAHVENAQDVCGKVGQSIQKYNDLVGYFQVNKGLEGVDKIIEEINGAIEASNALNGQIVTFVKNGMDMLQDLSVAGDLSNREAEPVNAMAQPRQSAAQEQPQMEMDQIENTVAVAGAERRNENAVAVVPPRDTCEDINVGEFVTDAERGDMASIERTVGRCPSVVNYRGSDRGRTALMEAADHNRSNVLSYLIESKADVNIQDNDMRTALIDGADRQYVEIVRLLLAAAANPNLQEASGETALMKAVKRKNLGLARELLESGADASVTDRKGKKAVDMANFDREMKALLLNAPAAKTVVPNETGPVQARSVTGNATAGPVNDSAK